jgi:hypothetical protein
MHRSMPERSDRDLGHTRRRTASNPLIMGDLSCQRFTDLARDYVDGKLPPEDVRPMSAHRLTCARCNKLLADYERIPEVVRRATDASMPAGAKARLRRILSRAWSWRR